MRNKTTILLGSGCFFDYQNADNSAPTIEDIAYGLAYTARFRGQCVDQSTGKRVFYSVAEHCVRMAHTVMMRVALEGVVYPVDTRARISVAYDALMHELGETVVGDPPSPLKIACPEIKHLEKGIEHVLHRQFNVEMADRKLIKQLDTILYMTERDDLMPHVPGLTPVTVRLRDRIIPWSAESAAENFIGCYRQISGILWPVMERVAA